MPQTFPPVAPASVTDRPTPPVSLADSLTAIDRAASPAAATRVVADTLAAWGFGRVIVALRDATLAPGGVALAGDRDPARAPDAMRALPGAVWRQRLPLLTPFADGGLFRLPGHDAWVAREFWALDPAAAVPADAWGPLDLLIGLVHGPTGELLGTVLLAESHAVHRPDRTRSVEVVALLRHFGLWLSHAALGALAERRAGRLQRLQDAATALARSLDADEIVRELARQAARATDAQGAMVAVPDLARGTLQTWTRVVAGSTRAPDAPRPLGDGVLATVARTGRPLRSQDAVRRGDVGVSEAWSPLRALDVIGDAVSECGPPGSVLAVPIMAGIRLLGVLAVHAAERDRFTAEDEELVVTMAAQAATALANAQRYAESERERRQTEALAEVARAVSGSLRPGDVLQLILRHALALLGAQGACLALREERWMHIVAAQGGAGLLAGVHVPVDASLLGRVASDGGVVLTNDLPRHDGAFLPLQRITRITNAVIVPLAAGRERIGAIAVINRDIPFTDEDARILERLGDQVAVAVANARLFDAVERATREWKLAFDAVTSGLAVLDDARRIVRCNRRLADLCVAVSVTDVLGRTFPDLLWPDPIAPLAREAIARAAESGSATRTTFDDSARGVAVTLSVSPHPAGGTVVAVDTQPLASALPELEPPAVESPATEPLASEPRAG
jgi:GAF domain-containing protein